MYAVYTRRRLSDPSRQHQLLQRAGDEFFPKLQQAPGFVSFTLIDGQDGTRLAVMLWESRAQAEAFQGEAARWQRVLNEVAAPESQGAGEVLQHLTTQT